MGFRHCVLLLCVLLVGCAVQPPVSEPLTIGVVLPLTGLAAYWGEPAARGVQLALDDLTEAGHPVAVRVEDSRADAATAAVTVTKLIDVDQVDALYVEFSGPAAAALPIAADRQTPLIYSAYVQPGSNEYAFKMYFDPVQECAAMTRFAAHENRTRISALIMQVPYAPDCKAAIVEAARTAEIQVDIYDFDVSATDFRAMLTKMKSRDTQAIITFAYESHALEIFTEKEEVGLHAPLYCHRGVCYTDKVLATLNPVALEGGLLFDLPVEPKFAQRFRALYPAAGDVDVQAAAGGYDAIMYLWHASVLCGPENRSACITRELPHVRDYESVVLSDGFVGTHGLHLRTTYSVYRNGTTVVVPAIP